MEAAVERWQLPFGYGATRSGVVLCWGCPSMAAFKCAYCTSGPGARCHSNILVSPVGGSMGPRFAALDTGRQQRQEQLWQDLVTNPSEWLDNRQDKRSYRHPDFCHRRSGEGLWMDNRFKPLWVDSRLANLGAQLQSGFKSVQGASTGDELQNLCQQGKLDKAMDLLLRMDQQGIVPSLDAYRCLLKACTKRKALGHASRVHAHLAQRGLESFRFLGESVVSTLVKCGGFDHALQVFERLPHRDVYCWTAVISGYADVGETREAVRLYSRMVQEGVKPNAFTFVSLLKACGFIANLEWGRHIHMEVIKYGCESHVFVGASLIDMYGKCGSIMEAQSVFDGLYQRDVVSWNVMLAAYAQQGHPEKALQLYEKMWEDGVSPDVRTFVSALQACCMIAEKDGDLIADGQAIFAESLGRAKAIHADVWRKGYDTNVFVGSTLISLYGKYSCTSDAQKVFDGLFQHDVVSWTAMLGAYNQQGQVEKVLHLYYQMQHEGVCPDPHSFVCAIQAIGMLAESEVDVVVHGQSTKVISLQMGKVMHADAWRKGLDLDLFVANSLISMYSKCGGIGDAENLFHELSMRDEFSWTALLTAYSQQGQAAKALQLYIQMQEEGVSPDTCTSVIALQSCCMIADNEGNVRVDGLSTKVKSLHMGKAIHADTWRKGYDFDVFVCSTLITMYGKSGSIEDAEIVFYGLSQQNVVSWTAMLAACVEQGEAEQTLRLYSKMLQEGVSPDVRTFVIALQACGQLAQEEVEGMVEGQPTKVECLEMGKVLHAHAWRKGFHLDVYVGSTIISLYGKCGSIVDAQKGFDGLSDQHVVSWNAMLAAHVEQLDAREAFQLYGIMRQEGPSPNDRTFVSAIQACRMLAEREADTMLDGTHCKVESLEMGKAIHSDARRRGYDSDLFVGSSLISMYGKCGSILDAECMFDGLSKHNVVSWTAMLAVCVEQGEVDKALDVYRKMQQEGVSPDALTIVSTFQACSMLADKEVDVLVDGRLAKVKSLAMVKAIHADACSRGYDLDVIVGCTLVNLYSKCGSIEDARYVFDYLPKHDAVAWNSMLALYVEQAQAEKAWQLFKQMQEQGVSPNEVTLACILQACSKAGSLSTLRHIHQTLASTGKDLSPLLANTLIDAYGRCASMVDAQTVFDAMPQYDVVLWTSLIAGYARQGQYTASLQCYDKMLQSGIEPDGVTFLTVLAACSHGGLVVKGAEYFESMSRRHGITPEIEHYVSLVDLFGRAGAFTRLENLLLTMPIEPDLAIWLSVLGACRKHGKVELGEQAFDCAVRLQPKHPAAYVLLSNIYADAGRLDLARRMKNLRLKEGAWKKPGQTWIEHEQEVHTFMVGEPNNRAS